MKIAVILPDLRKEAPTKIAIDIAENYYKKGNQVDIFVFRDIPELKVNFKVFILSFFFNDKLQEYDVIHSHNFLPDLYIYWYKKKINAKCISTLHNDIEEVYEHDGNFLFRKLIPWLWFKSLLKFDKVVCLSKRAQKRLIKRGDYSTEMIYNGISVDLTKEISSKHKILFNKIKQDNILIGIVATLYQVKGIEQVLKAVTRLQNYSLVIIGDGPAKNYLEQVANKLNLKDKCLFLGRHLNGYAYFKHFELYIMSSYSEGFPLAVLEAAAFSVPTVCSKIPVFEELFESDEIVFFNLNQIDDLVNSIKKIADKKNIGKSFNKKYLDNYTSNKMNENYIKLIDNL